MNFKKLFLNYCSNKELEINKYQIKTVDSIHKFYQLNFNNYFLLKLFSKKLPKIGFYLDGDVGVGKTMILNIFMKIFIIQKKNFILMNLCLIFMILYFKIKIKKS